MAKMQKLEEEFELNCSAQKIFEIMSTKQSDISKLCSQKVPGVQAHQNDWLSVGTTRKWDFVIDGKNTSIVDKIDVIDEKNMLISRSVIDGEIMSHYKTLKIHSQQFSKGNNTSTIKVTFEFEKIHEDSPEPKELFKHGLDVLKELGHHLSSTKN